MDGPTAFQLLAVRMAPAETTEPPRTANAAATHVLNELVVLTFGYYDPMRVKSPPTEGDAAIADATPFVQVAMPRTVFAAWMSATLSSFKGLSDRDSLGWADIARLFADGAVGRDR